MVNGTTIYYSPFTIYLSLTTCNAQTPCLHQPCGGCLPSSSPHYPCCWRRRGFLPPDDQSLSFRPVRARRKQSNESPTLRAVPDELRLVPDTSNRQRDETLLPRSV